MAKIKTLTAVGILILTFLAQIFGHLLLKNYMPNAAVGGVGFVLVALLFTYVLFIRRDVFGFILIVYICSHFSYADNQGGLWNLMTFGVLVIFFFVSDIQKQEGFLQKDYPMSILIGIFLLWNFAGWAIKNPMPLVSMLEGIAALLGFLLMFKLSSNVRITPDRVRLFLTVSFFMVLYQFAVALNQRYMLVDWNTPLIGNYSKFGSLLEGDELDNKEAITSGTLRHFELFGEYGLLLTCLLLPLLSASTTQKVIRFGSNRVVIMIFLCIAFIMLTSNRAAAVLLVLAIAFFYVLFAIRLFSSIDRVGNQAKVIIVVAVLVPIIGVYVGLDQIIKDFSDLAPRLAKLSIGGVVSGEDINRGELVSAGALRLKSESWMFGYGYGIPQSNQWAWFGVDTFKHDVGVTDLHSLYLSLPELFGWVGSLAFVSMIVITEFRLFIVSLKYRRKNSFLLVLALGFTMFWGVFLVNEYKISIFRNPNYQMLFWIWLGLSNSLVKTIYLEKLSSVQLSPLPFQFSNRSKTI
ncbi:MAG: hypothetical protein HOP23_03170 [Methylococcaceae bacterium]|nr:hypothetical protein [Methylococcaceae bacterium]